LTSAISIFILFAYATTSSQNIEEKILLIDGNNSSYFLTFSSVEKIPVNDTSLLFGKTTEDLTETQASVKPDNLVYAESISSCASLSNDSLTIIDSISKASGFFPLPSSFSLFLLNTFKECSTKTSLDMTKNSGTGTSISLSLKRLNPFLPTLSSFNSFAE